MVDRETYGCNLLTHEATSQCFRMASHLTQVQQWEENPSPYLGVSADQAFLELVIEELLDAALGTGVQETYYVHWAMNGTDANTAAVGRCEGKKEGDILVPFGSFGAGYGPVFLRAAQFRPHKSVNHAYVFPANKNLRRCIVPFPYNVLSESVRNNGRNPARLTVRENECLAYLDARAARRPISCVLFELALVANGLALTECFVYHLQKLADRHGFSLVVDEVLTMGRAGVPLCLSFQWSWFRPHAVTLGKWLGVGVMLYREELSHPGERPVSTTVNATQILFIQQVVRLVCYLWQTGHVQRVIDFVQGEYEKYLGTTEYTGGDEFFMRTGAMLFMHPNPFGDVYIPGRVLVQLDATEHQIREAAHQSSQRPASARKQIPAYRALHMYIHNRDQQKKWLEKNEPERLTDTHKEQPTPLDTMPQPARRFSSRRKSHTSTRATIRAPRYETRSTKQIHEDGNH